MRMMNIVGVALLALLFITSALFAEARDYPKYEHEITRPERDEEKMVDGVEMSRRKCHRRHLRRSSRRCRSPFPLVPSPPPPFFHFHAPPPAVIFPPPLDLSPPPRRPVFPRPPWLAPPNPPPLVPIYSDPPPPFFRVSPPVPGFQPPYFSTPPPPPPLVPVP
nr:hypothetical protein Iba_scaffold34137CG0020 [Ipomoea batatas]GMD07610.1 hypothetical protein Iba_chr06cCG8840 [Ipomoea batatas]